LAKQTFFAGGNRLCLDFPELPPPGEPRLILIEAFKRIEALSIQRGKLRFKNGDRFVTLNKTIAQKSPEFFLNMKKQ